MKKTVLFLLLSMATLSAGAQESGSEIILLEDIEKGWQGKTITNVPSGTLAAMLKRFDETWPTYTVGDALEVIESGEAEKVIDQNTGYRVVNDAKNGYVQVTNDGSDEEYMSACVWRRDDGHRLLAVVLGKPTDPHIDFICFYDYDPAKRTLTPDTFVTEIITRGAETSKFPRYHELPRRGKNILVWADEDRFEFAWNGMDFSLVSFPVAFAGSAPTISDLVQAFLTHCVDDKTEVEVDEAGVAFKHIWADHRRGTPLPENETMTVDERSGFVSCENLQDNYLTKWEMCYWNEADGQHKLFAYSVWCYENGKYSPGQYDGLTFCRYDQKTKTMRWIDNAGFDVRYGTDDGASLSYALPRTGKDIVATAWYDDGRQKHQTMKWNGHGFTPVGPLK